MEDGWWVVRHRGWGRGEGSRMGEGGGMVDMGKSRKRKLVKW